jgi:hypothetical protein
MVNHRVIDHVDLDYRILDTADLLIARRFIGTDSINMILSGSFASHVAVVV